MPQMLMLDDEEYLEIEETIASTARGRAFLRARDRRARVIGSDEVRQMLAALNRVSQVQSPQLLQRDLKDLRDHIERSKSEIAALVAKDSRGISGARLTGATEELYEIVASTERATSEILNAAERIQEIAARFPQDSAERASMESLTMEIFTACSFQDITGQGIAKVVATMAYVEQRVNKMVSLWDADGADAEEPGLLTGLSAGKPRPAERTFEVVGEEAKLLHGPQLPGKGLGQDAIDALLGGGDQPKTVNATPVVPLAGPALKQPPRESKRKLSADRVDRAAPAAAAPALDQSSIDALFA